MTRIRILQIGYLLALIVCLALLGYLLLTAYQAHSALCALESDYNRRADNTEKFIEQGGRIQGLDEATLRISVENLRQTAKTIDKEIEC